MLTAAELDAALRAQVTDPALLPSVESIARTIVRLLNREITQAEAEAQLAAAPPLLRSLEGRRLDLSGSAVAFGNAVIAGDVNVHDVAGGNLTKIAINIGGEAFTLVEASADNPTEQQLVGKLQPMNRSGLGQIATTILGIQDLSPDADLVWVVARALLATDLETLSDCVCNFARLTDAATAKAILDIATPFCWIQRDAARLIPGVSQHPPSQRGVGLNAAQTWTGMGYLARASMARRHWQTEIERGDGEDQFEDLSSSIASQLFRKFDCDRPEVCLEKIQRYDTDVFVVIPPDPPQPDVLQKLRERWPPVTFVLLTGPRGQMDFNRLELPNVDYLMPELAADAEQRAWTAWDTARWNVDNTCTQP